MVRQTQEAFIKGLDQGYTLAKSQYIDIIKKTCDHETIKKIEDYYDVQIMEEAGNA